MFRAEVIVAVKYKNCCFYDRKLIGFYYRNMDGWFLGDSDFGVRNIIRKIK